MTKPGVRANRPKEIVRTVYQSEHLNRSELALAALQPTADGGSWRASAEASFGGAFERKAAVSTWPDLLAF